MSDFLAEIAERSLTTAQAIRPRPLSVFEPFQATGAIGSAQQPQAEQDYRLSKSDTVGTVSMEPVAVTTNDFPVAQSEANTIAVQAPRLGVSAAMADPRHVASTPAEQAARQGEYRPAAMHSPPDHATSIGPNVPADETISPGFQIRRQPPLESPDGLQTVNPSRPPATVKGIDRTGQEFGVPDHQSKVARTISESTRVKPAIERVEVEMSVATQFPQQSIAPRTRV